MALPTLLEAVEALPAFTRLAGAMPGARTALTVGGLHGSSDAVVLAALARRFPQRLFVVLCAGVPEAERWLADLDTLLDASLGMIALEQNFVMKVFSVAAVVLMPPTLIAGIYGMNFKHMPELPHIWGYPWALLLMLLSAVLPYWLARRRGWL